MDKYLLSIKAMEDLSGIWDYTFDTWSEKQADLYYNMLIRCFDELAQNPNKGKKYPEIENKLLGFRIGQHIIFYQPADNKKILIVRILHSKMDLKNRIRD